MPTMVMADDPECDDAPDWMRTDDLIRRCHAETARYYRRERHDDRYSMELVRRAVVDRDGASWTALVALYEAQVRVWCRGACPAADADEMQILAWERFWWSYTPAKLAAAGSMASVLRYLKMCAHSVVADAHRQTARLPAGEVPDDVASPLPSPAEVVADAAARAAFWSLIDRQLVNERERALVYLKHVLGLSPAQVQARRPDLFPAVADVYRVGRNVLERLKRSLALRVWLEAEGSL